jgi:hypothetical protein
MNTPKARVGKPSGRTPWREIYPTTHRYSTKTTNGNNMREPIPGQDQCCGSPTNCTKTNLYCYHRSPKHSVERVTEQKNPDNLQTPTAEEANGTHGRNGFTR